MVKASTQKFTEIQDILDDIVILSGGNACLVIEVQATNFALLSLEEQEAKIYSYAQLLNSLSFPIQVLIRNRRIDISSYLKLLDVELQKASTPRDGMEAAQAGKVTDYIRQYEEFVSEMVKVNTVLDKKFYMILSFSALEKGVKGVLKQDDFLGQAKAALHTKADSLLTQLSRLSLLAKTLGKEELIRLFYEMYNQDSAGDGQIEQSLKAPIVTGRQEL